jgi:glycosyltransferase involved in cell wall biosynthesis
MRIILLEPYLTGSHAVWAREYAEHSRHDVRIIGLEGRYWKWRMHGGAVTLAAMFMAGDDTTDLILTTDMLDLPTFLALTRHQTAAIRTAIYFHENQLCYPWSENDRDLKKDRDAHYAFINFASALAADIVLFNSQYHQTAFLRELGRFLRSFPDYNETRTIETIRLKSDVLYLGLDLRSLDGYQAGIRSEAPPLILWNHRWEYDKNPEDFFRALFILSAEGLDFEVALLGESFGEMPAVFNEARSRLAERIVQFGYAENRGEYATWLWKADIIPVTSIQDFFGASVVQAMYCNCCPILPHRLAYPEHIPPEYHEDFFYRDFEDLLAMLRHRITNIDETRRIETRHLISHYDWATMAPRYDVLFQGRDP